MKTIFRSIVALSVALYLVYWFIPYFEHLWLAEDELDLISWNGYGAYISYSMTVSVAFFFGYLVSSVGLLFFVAWARVAFLLLVTFDLILSPLLGFVILDAVSNVFYTLIIMLDGAIITMMYLTSVSQYFNKSSD